MQITCSINITNASPGAWDVVVANDDFKGGTLFHGFSITALPPVLLSPANTTTDLSLTPTFYWHKTAYDSIYTIQISASSTFSSFLVNNNHVPDTFLSVNSGILSGTTTYFWKVSTTKKGGYSTDFCSPWQFTTSIMAFGVPTLQVPSDNAVSVSINPVLIWNRVTNALSYNVQVASDSLFNTIHTLLADLTKTFDFAVNGQKGTIRYALPKAEHVLLRLYNIKGQLQSEFVNKRQSAGFYSLKIQSNIAAAGSFLMVFKAGEFHREKMVFITK